MEEQSQESNILEQSETITRPQMSKIFQIAFYYLCILEFVFTDDQINTNYLNTFEIASIFKGNLTPILTTLKNLAYSDLSKQGNFIFNII